MIVEGIQEIAAGVEEMNTDWRPYVDMLMSWSPTNLDVGLDGGETARQFITRFTNAIAAMEQAGDEHVALVSHGDALRVLAAVLRGGSHRDVDFEAYPTWPNGHVETLELS